MFGYDRRRLAQCGARRRHRPACPVHSRPPATVPSRGAGTGGRGTPRRSSAARVPEGPGRNARTDAMPCSGIVPRMRSSSAGRGRPVCRARTIITWLIRHGNRSEYQPSDGTEGHGSTRGQGSYGSGRVAGVRVAWFGPEPTLEGGVPYVATQILCSLPPAGADVKAYLVGRAILRSGSEPFNHAEQSMASDPTRRSSVTARAP